MNDTPLIVYIGCTASGKSAAALQEAERIGGEIISCDSMQFYRDLPIGTAQPSRRNAPKSGIIWWERLNFISA